MTSLELADHLENKLVATNDQAADMLHRQHEAIKQLRGTLETISNYVGKSNPPSRIWVRAEKALKDTEGL